RAFASRSTPPTATSTLSLHDALPICALVAAVAGAGFGLLRAARRVERKGARRLWTAAALLLSAAFTALSIIAYLGMGVSPSSSRSEEHTSELQSRENLVCRLLLEKKK